MYVSAPYPVRVEGRLERPSRALWLIKWLLALPHYVVLAFLWLAFTVLTLVAFVVVLGTGRYPRGIFDFNLGVMRWTWRVAFYAYGANGTDEYPPFTLADVPKYPARLEVTYPEWQRRGLPLIGWWFAGFPHYVLACAFAGGIGAVWATHVGIIALLVFVGALVLLFRGTYPRELFDLVLGLNRWALRVVAYAALMTPVYPPFRLDAGEAEPGGLMISTPAERLLPRERSGGGLILAAVFGSVAAVLSFGTLASGTAALVFDQTQRDHAGYISTETSSYSTPTYALVSNSYRAGTSGDLFVARDMLGTVRVRAEGARPLFVGVARASDVNAYLGSTRRAVGAGFDLRASDFRIVGEGAPPATPAAQRFWAARAVGAGRLTLAWTPRNGNWRIVVMNADASAVVHTQLNIGARFPRLLWIGIGLLGASAVLGLLAGGLLYAATSSTRGKKS